jgi:hypothetical protein
MFQIYNYFLGNSFFLHLFALLVCLFFILLLFFSFVVFFLFDIYYKYIWNIEDFLLQNEFPRMFPCWLIFSFLCIVMSMSTIAWLFLFVIFSFWPLYCLFIFELQILITPYIVLSSKIVYKEIIIWNADIYFKIFFIILVNNIGWFISLSLYKKT